ncbi:protein-L-isoaspartate O-methyltransferase [bacterium BMS3Bbin06]|nr:protein-L-isoaspartate O-methyltransferase [bacterium BMS3Bbin06]
MPARQVFSGPVCLDTGFNPMIKKRGKDKKSNVCPFWAGYLLLCPLRNLVHNPEKILRPYVKEGMRVLDLGAAMGFFSLPLARMVGPGGKVVSVDVQGRMTESLKRRAQKAGLLNIIEPRTCNNTSLGIDDLSGEIDFALAFAVVHEVTDVSAFFSEVYRTLKDNGELLFAEPKGHVPSKKFERSVDIAVEEGFKIIARPRIFRSKAVLFKKKGESFTS